MLSNNADEHFHGILNCHTDWIAFSNINFNWTYVPIKLIVKWVGWSNKMGQPGLPQKSVSTANRICAGGTKQNEFRPDDSDIRPIEYIPRFPGHQAKTHAEQSFRTFEAVALGVWAAQFPGPVASSTFGMQLILTAWREYADRSFTPRNVHHSARRMALNIINNNSTEHLVRAKTTAARQQNMDSTNPATEDGVATSTLWATCTRRISHSSK